MNRTGDPPVGDDRPVGKVGEFDLIRRLVTEILRHGIAKRGDRTDIRLDIGDDACVLAQVPGHDLVVTTDVQIANRHFLPSVMAPREIGRRVIAINLSDLAAMGAEPAHVFVSLGIHQDLTVEDIVAIYEGMLDCLDEHPDEAGRPARIVGGNVSGTDHAWFIDITAHGHVPEKSFVPRSGAKPGDALYVSGQVGASAAGLFFLRQALEAERERSKSAHPDHRIEHEPTARDLRSAESSTGTTDWQPASQMHVRNAIKDADRASLVRAYVAPIPRIALGRLLRNTGLAHAMCDVSDGLPGDLGHIAASSSVGLEIDVDTLPVAPVLARAAKSAGRDALDWILGPSDDYELVFTVPPDADAELKEAASKVGVPLHRIGVATDAHDEVRFNGLPPGRKPPTGWDHFRSSDPA